MPGISVNPAPGSRRSARISILKARASTGEEAPSPASPPPPSAAAWRSKPAAFQDSLADALQPGRRLRLANASTRSLIVCRPFILCGGGAQREEFKGSQAPPAAGEPGSMGTRLSSRSSSSRVTFPISHCGELVNGDGGHIVVSKLKTLRLEKLFSFSPNRHVFRILRKPQTFSIVFLPGGAEGS